MAASKTNWFRARKRKTGLGLPPARGSRSCRHGVLGRQARRRADCRGNTGPDADASGEIGKRRQDHVAYRQPDKQNCTPHQTGRHRFNPNPHHDVGGTRDRLRRTIAPQPLPTQVSGSPPLRRRSRRAPQHTSTSTKPVTRLLRRVWRSGNRRVVSMRRPPGGGLPVQNREVRPVIRQLRWSSPRAPPAPRRRSVSAPPRRSARRAWSRPAAVWSSCRRCRPG